MAKNKIIWHLEPIAFGHAEKSLLGLFNKAKSMGFRNFQLSNLWHLALPLERTGASSSFEFNLLNSQALFAIRELGVDLPQFSIETDLENLASALSNYPYKVAITVYGFIPLFTSRVRHPIYTPKKPVQSMKGETFHWRWDGNIGYLYSNTPISFVEHMQDILRYGVTRLILDLRFSPMKRRRIPRLPGSWKGLKARFRGRKFNLKGLLE